MAAHSERRIRIGMAIVFVLLTAVVVVPLFDSSQRTGTERTVRIVGGIVLILLAAVSAFGPSSRRG
jgi:putative Ca2+/H+ antiporter (TMEM165/GDT1 family)